MTRFPGVRRLIVPVPIWAWLAAALWIGLASDFGLQVYDEGSLLVGARWVANGGVPSRDFWTAYPPGIFWVVGLAFRIFGEQVIVNRLLHDVIALGVCVAGYHLMAALLGRGRWALAGFLSLALYVGASRVSYGYPPVLCLLLGFWSLSDLLGTGTLPTAAHLRRAGLAAGLCAIVRYDIALYLVAASFAGGLLVLAGLPDGSAGSRALLRAAAQYLSGFLGPVVIAYGIQVALVGVGPLYAQLVDFPLRIFPSVRGLPLDRPFRFLFISPRSDWDRTWFLLEFPRVLPYLAMLVAVVGAVRALSRARHQAAPLLFAVSLLALAFVNQFRVRSDAVAHAWPLVVTALIVATTVLAWTTASRRRLTRAGGWVSLAIGVIVLVPGMIYRGWNLLAARYREPTIAVASPWAAGIRIPAADTGTNALLNDLHTRAADERYLFSGTTDHDQLVFNDALIYFLTGRASPTPYPDLVPGVIDTAPVQRDVVQALNAHAIDTVVLIDYRSTEPNDSSKNTHVDILDRMLTDQFRQVAQYPPYYKVLRRAQP